MIKFNLRRLIGVIVIMLILDGGTSLALADADPVTYRDSFVKYTFGGQITFMAQYEFTTAPESVFVFYKPTNDTRTTYHSALVVGGDVSFSNDLKLEPLTPFAEVEFWFVVKTLDGKEVTSPKKLFIYNDNRFDWNMVESAPFRVYWYAGDAVFGQTVLDAAQSGMKRIREFITLSKNDWVNIYVYSSGADMQSTYLLGGIEMIAGHANPELGVMVVSLPPGPDQRFETERQVPHELTHILLYRFLGPRYENLPVWLNEGLASMSESVINPDYTLILKDANENHKLLPMTSLCGKFPGDAAGFYLAYGQSESFTRYLYGQYGASGLESLMSNYADGMDCERGSQVALGASLSRLDEQWQVYTFGRQVSVKTIESLLPWAVLLAVVLLAPLLMTVFSRKQNRQPTRDGGKKI